MRDVVPAENAMPLNAALEWSWREWEREERKEREQRRRLLDLEESSDDELYRPTPPHFGDAGQGSSHQAPLPQDDDSSDDDGGDYTRFYCHFGM
jgi:hypothetical protein